MNSKKPKDTVSVGGMWQRLDDNGRELDGFSLSLEADTLPQPDKKGRIRLTVMSNSFKKEQKEGAPDFNVFYGIRDDGDKQDTRQAPGRQENAPRQGGNNGYAPKRRY
jgi:hypothetical protein